MSKLNCPTCGVHIDDHPASQCLNEWIATDIMGEVKPDIVHEYLHLGRPVYSEGGNWYCSQEYDKGDVCIWYPRNFSGYIAAAWEVLDKFQSAEIEREFGGNTIIVLEAVGAGWFSANASHTSLAICRAAIKACSTKVT